MRMESLENRLLMTVGSALVEASANISDCRDGNSIGSEHWPPPAVVENSPRRFFSRGLHNNGVFLPWHRGYAVGKNAQPDQVTDKSLRNRLEHGPGMHDSVHCTVSDTMQSAGSSNDPVFLRDQAQVDAVMGEDLFPRGGDNDFNDLVAGRCNRLEHGPGLHDSIYGSIGERLNGARSSNDPVFFGQQAKLGNVLAR